MVKFQLEEFHRNIPNYELLKDLKNVATLLKKDSLSEKEYTKNGKYHSSTIIRRFGSWFKAMEKAGLKKSRNLGITEEEYFKNIEEVWIKLGRQPKYNDMKKPISKFAAGAYEYRFGTWRKALEKFINYINKDEPLSSDNVEINENEISIITTEYAYKHKTKRNISWRLRFIMMRRDNFKCKICGRSPATDPKIKLHVDHIVAYSKGGETIPENLQTLCSICNIGKSNL